MNLDKLTEKLAGYRTRGLNAVKTIATVFAVLGINADSAIGQLVNGNKWLVATGIVLLGFLVDYFKVAADKRGSEISADKIIQTINDLEKQRESISLALDKISRGEAKIEPKL